MLISMVPGHKASRSGSSLFLKEDTSGLSKKIVHMVHTQTVVTLTFISIYRILSE